MYFIEHGLIVFQGVRAIIYTSKDNLCTGTAASAYQYRSLPKLRYHNSLEICTKTGTVLNCAGISSSRYINAKG
jgi:hypothetical protein